MIKRMVQHWLGIDQLLYQGKPIYPKDDPHPGTVETASDYIEPLKKGYGYKSKDS